MADTARLLELAERVEWEPASEKLDAEIARESEMEWRSMLGAIPRFTASLDAAEALVPEHYSWRAYAHPKVIGVEDEPRAYADVYRLAPDLTTAGTVLTRELLSGPHEAEATTPAAALCAAALRARAAMMEKTDG